MWLVTREKYAAAVNCALDNDPLLSDRLQPLYVELADWLVKLKKRVPRTRLLYYVLWQRKARVEIERLCSVNDVDILHHVTFATCWLPAGALSARVNVPRVWGPVGGGAITPLRLYPYLGIYGSLVELFRRLLIGVAIRLIGRPTALRADFVLVQDPLTAAKLGIRHRLVATLPNPAIEEALACSARSPDPRRVRVLYVGRLVPFKGMALALRGFAAVATDGWEMRIYGDGPDGRRLRRLARRLGISEMVQFEGNRPRSEVLDAMSSASVFLYMSGKDGAPWAVAEAITAGVPVVCLDHGSLAMIVGDGGVLVPIEAISGATVGAALRKALGSETNRRRWLASRLPREMAEVYASVVADANAKGASGSNSDQALSGVGQIRTAHLTFGSGESHGDA